MRSSLFALMAFVGFGCAESTPVPVAPAAGAAPVVDVGSQAMAEREAKQKDPPPAPAPPPEEKAAKPPVVEPTQARAQLPDGMFGPLGPDASVTGVGGLVGLGSSGTLSGFGTGTFGPGGGANGAVRTKPPQVRMGAVSMTGKLPPEVVQRIVRQNFGRFRLCYEAGLKRNPKVQGSVSVRFVIGPEGNVVSSNTAASALPDQAVITCVVRSFMSLSFPKPEGGGIVVVTYPMTFTPGD